MKTMMPTDMIEATRLTREGRLIEATAVLQRMLQSGMEPDTQTTGSYTAADSRPLGAADIVEVTPEMRKVRSARRTSSTGPVEADSEGGLSANLGASPSIANVRPAARFHRKGAPDWRSAIGCRPFIRTRAVGRR